MDLPVVFAIDRAGIVGNDGETHQGVYDISFLRFIPNMILVAPRDAKSLEYAMEFGYECKSPCAIRYPRGSYETIEYEATPFELGISELLKEAQDDILFIGYGSGVSKAINTAKLIDKDIAILDLKFVKPLDKQMLLKLATQYTKWYIFSDSQASGGVGSAILELLAYESVTNVNLTTFEYDDIFIQHGDTKDVEKDLGITPEQIVKLITNNE
jgi:1-deoxy-D-xylulose-5-phosphate synthase